jgi:hypothetical protein
MELASWLQNEFEIDGRSVVAKKDERIATNDGKTITVNRKKDFWVRASKDGSGRVVACNKILLHTSCLDIAKKFGMDLSKIKLNWLSIPTASNGLSAIVECTYPDCVPVIGEANSKNLAGAISSYAATMALKRGVDRVITHYTGLYQKGFLSEEELGGDFDDNRVEKTSPRTAALKELQKVVDKRKLSRSMVNKYIKDANEDDKVNVATATEEEILKTIVYIQDSNL